MRNEREASGFGDALTAVIVLAEGDEKRSQQTATVLDSIVSRSTPLDKHWVPGIARGYWSCGMDVAIDHLVDQLESRNGRLVLNSVFAQIETSSSHFQSKTTRDSLSQHGAEIVKKLAKYSNAEDKADLASLLTISRVSQLVELSSDHVAEIMPFLIHGMESRDKEAVVNTASTLARYAPDTEGLVEPLVQIIGNTALYNSTHSAVRDAFEVLAILGPRAKDSVPTIVEALPVMTGGELWQHGHYLLAPDVAILAVETLIQIGPDAKESLPMLRKVVEKLEAHLANKKEGKGNDATPMFDLSLATGRDGTRMTEVIELAKKAIVEIGGQPGETPATKSKEQSGLAAPSTS